MKHKYLSKTLAMLILILSLTACKTNDVTFVSDSENTASETSSDADGSNIEIETSDASDIGFTDSDSANFNSDMLSSEDSSISADENSIVVEYTEDDIQAMHSFFLRADFLRMDPFEFSSDNFDYDSIMELLSMNEYKYFEYVTPKFSEFEENDLGGRTVNYYELDVVEDIIKENFAPDFNIREHDYMNNKTWDSERNLIYFNDYYIPYYGGITDIDVREEQVGNYYEITVLNAVECFTGLPETFEEFKELPHNKYTFTKLPNGKIAPYKMTMAEAENWEYKAAETAYNILEINKKNIKKEICEGKVEGYYVHDINNDGKFDLIAKRSGAEVYYDFDIKNDEKYGELYTSPNGDLWEYKASTYTNLSTGDTYCYVNSSVSNWGNDGNREITPLIVYKINNKNVSEEEYMNAANKVGLNDLKEIEYQYDITDYINTSHMDRDIKIAKLMMFCKTLIEQY